MSKLLIERYNTNLIQIIILVLVYLYPNITHSQPGWTDNTKYYFYTILDKNDNVISFKNNNKYSIMIDNSLYKSTNIPHDTLIASTEDNYNYEQGFFNQIRINDFSLSISRKNYYDR